MLGHIFLSYSHNDVTMMHRVRNTLRMHGLEIWTDEYLEPGIPSWKKVVQDALQSAECVVVLLSPTAKDSEFVAHELDYAEAHGKRIFPILGQGDNRSSIPFGYITAQWVDIRQETQYDAEMNKLIFTLRVHLGLETLAKEQSGTDTRLRKTTTGIDANDLDEESTRMFPGHVAKAIMVLQDRKSKWWRRVDAIHRLGELRNPATLSVLNAYLEDRDMEVQQAAQHAIARIAAETTSETQLLVRADTEYIDEDESSPLSPKKTVKIVVTGPSAELRRQFIRSISEIDVISIERHMTIGGITYPVSMDYGQITVGSDLVIYLFGSPGERQYDNIWETLADGMLGFVVVMDGNPNGFRGARAIVDNFGIYTDVPFVVAVDSSQSADSWQPNDIRIALKLDDHTKILPCIVNDHQAVKQSLLELVYLISERSDFHVSDEEKALSKPIYALIVEDDNEVGTLIQRTLAASGIEGQHVNSGHLALNALGLHKPDVMILDIAMPGMNGWEVLEAIKAVYYETNFPVIVLTAYDDPTNKLIGKLQNRVFRYLTKPFEITQLTGVVREATMAHSG